MTREVSTRGSDTSNEMSAGVSSQHAKLAYTAREFADLTGLTYATVCRLGREGSLTRIRAGKQKIIPAWEAERFLAVPDQREAPG